MISIEKILWVKFKGHEGVKYTGSKKYNPVINGDSESDKWKRIMGVVARCEGNHDTCVSYDGTGMTWGFLQWTFTSGRLQKLLESMKPSTAFATLFKKDNVQIFEAYGFKIEDGNFFDLKLGKNLNPADAMQKKRIDDICMSRTKPALYKEVIQNCKSLATIFAEAGSSDMAADAQIDFAVAEFKSALKPKRPIINKSIGDFLEGSWDTPLPALFFNLWQNNPGACFKLMANAEKQSKSTGGDIFQIAWKLVNKSEFGGWGWPKNKTPRCLRIGSAMKEFYGIDLPYYK